MRGKKFVLLWVVFSAIPMSQLLAAEGVFSAQNLNETFQRVLAEAGQRFRCPESTNEALATAAKTSPTLAREIGPTGLAQAMTQMSGGMSLHRIFPTITDSPENVRALAAAQHIVSFRQGCVNR